MPEEITVVGAVVPCQAVLPRYYRLGDFKWTKDKQKECSKLREGFVGAYGLCTC